MEMKQQVINDLLGREKRQCKWNEKKNRGAQSKDKNPK